MKKLLAIGIILLFIGLVFAPSISANASKQNEFVKITIEVCGIEGIKQQNVKITQEQAYEIVKLFESIEERLDNSNSMEEAVGIFNEAVIELDKLRVLPEGMSIKETQRLVTGQFKNNIAVKVFEDIYNRQRFSLGKDENLFCLIAGKITGFTLFTSLWNDIFSRALSWLPILLGPLFFILIYAFFTLMLITDLIDILNPICIGRYIFIYEKARGTILTFGLNGLKTWKNDIVGLIPHWLGMAGAVGFTGLRLHYFTEEDEDCSLFLGFALLVKIKEME